MAHPEPLTKAVDILKTMPKEHYLYMLNQKEPSPLLEIAYKQGLQVLTHEDAQGLWHILITKETVNLSDFLDV